VPRAVTAPAAYFSSLAAAAPAIHDLFQAADLQQPHVADAKAAYERHFSGMASDLRGSLGAAQARRLLPPQDAQGTVWAFFNKHGKCARGLQGKMCRSIADRYHTSLTTPGPNNEAPLFDRHDAANLLSASYSTAKLLLSTVPEDTTLALSDDDFKAALKLRLDAPTLGQRSMCAACQSREKVNDATHYQSCAHGTVIAARMHRHQQLVAALCDCAGMAGVHALAHASLPCFHDPIVNPQHLRPDALVFTPDATYMLDVSVIHPSTAEGLRAHSDRYALAAAKSREAVKVDKYSELAARLHMVFIPFVVESLGAIGECAERFLNTLAARYASYYGDEPFAFKTYSRRRIVMALARGNGSVAQAGRVAKAAAEALAVRGAGAHRFCL
jgi:hypothetical protein